MSLQKTEIKKITFHSLNVHYYNTKSVLYEIGYLNVHKKSFGFNE